MVVVVVDRKFKVTNNYFQLNTDPSMELDMSKKSLTASNDFLTHSNSQCKKWNIIYSLCWVLNEEAAPQNFTAPAQI